MKKEILQSRKSVSEGKRIEVTGLLHDRLEDSIDLMMQARQALLNARREHILTSEELFDKVYCDTVVYVDLIAVRIDHLEGNSPGTIRAAAATSGLADYPVDISAWHQDVDDLVFTISWFGDLIREAIERSANLGDQDTADIFTRVSRGVDMNLWFTSRRASFSNGHRGRDTPHSATGMERRYSASN